MDSAAQGIAPVRTTLVAPAPVLEPLTQLELFATGFYELFALQTLLILYWVLSASAVESPRVGACFD